MSRMHKRFSGSSWRQKKKDFISSNELISSFGLKRRRWGRWLTYWTRPNFSMTKSSRPKTYGSHKNFQNGLLCFCFCFFLFLFLLLSFASSAPNNGSLDSSSSNSTTLLSPPEHTYINLKHNISVWFTRDGERESKKKASPRHATK